MYTRSESTGVTPAKRRADNPYPSSSSHGSTSRTTADSTPFLDVTHGEHVLTDYLPSRNSQYQSVTQITNNSSDKERPNFDSLNGKTYKNKNYSNKSLSKTPFSKSTPRIQSETPLIIATARQSGSGILTSCNTESIYQLTKGSNSHQSAQSSAYFSKWRSSRCSTPLSASQLASSSVSSSASGVSSSARGHSSSRSLCTSALPGWRVGTRETTEGIADSDDLNAADVSCIRNLGPRDDGDSFGSQIYMGMLWYCGKLGVAYYDLETTLIHIMLDTQDTEDFQMACRVIRELNPVQIVVSSKQDDRLLSILRNYEKDKQGDIVGGDNSVLQFLPSIDFSLEISKRRILSVDLPSIPDHFSDVERALNISSLVPFESTCMVRALGGLLKYLDKMRLGIELEERGTKLPVLNINIFSPCSHMLLDNTAYSALQIFQREAHPSVYKSGTGHGAKEGLSLFGIMNRTKSTLGSRMLRSWFLQPLKDLQRIRERHEAVEYFCSVRNQELVLTLEEAVKHVKNITKILTRMHQAQASVGDWKALYETVYHASSIKEICRVQPQTIYIFKQVTENFTDALHNMTNLINKIVDFPETIAQGRFVVKPNVDSSLDRKKRIFSELPEIMTQMAVKELQTFGDCISECSVIYMTQIGYLVAIPEYSISGVSKEDGEDGPAIEGLDFVFASNNVLHYRSKGTRELDTLYGDTRCDITDHETTIMHRLQNTILEHTQDLLAVLDRAAELDCLMALATCAREYNYIKPTMVEENIIEVKTGRHPIQEVCCSTFVPNDVISNSEYGKVKVLTGPNACGKSVYLKQVALIIYMAQVGSFVPAEAARLGLIDSMYTRVRSLESVSVGLSTFMLDINQMALALCNAGERSLCVIDEFGKGTDMIDGVALLCASLSHWVKMGAGCPHVVVSTHFHSIIHQHLLPRSPLIKYMTLETLHNGDELVFLYQLVEGNTGSSYACHAAAQAGLPNHIVKRGIEICKLIRDHKPIQRVDTVGTDTQNKRCEAIVEKFLELDLETADVKSFLSEFVLATMEGKL